MGVDDKSKKKTEPKAVEKAQSGKVVITQDIRKNWIRLRQAWNGGYEPFIGVISMLSLKQANDLYDVVRLGLFKDSYAVILREHPELRGLVGNDDDRLFMHDAYEALSDVVGRREKPPPYVVLKQRFGSKIGRDMPELAQWP